MKKWTLNRKKKRITGQKTGRGRKTGGGKNTGKDWVAGRKIRVKKPIQNLLPVCFKEAEK